MDVGLAGLVDVATLGVVTLGGLLRVGGTLVVDWLGAELITLGDLVVVSLDWESGPPSLVKEEVEDAF